MTWSSVGTISGTSADGIDLAEIGTDGETVDRFGPSATIPYRLETRQAVLDAVAAGPADRSSWPKLAEAVTADHAEAIAGFLATEALAPQFVVFHGQTVWHDPLAGETVQLGDPQALADALNLAVIADVRLADMAAGGQGAPMVPVYHRALLHGLPLPGGQSAEDALCFLNIGGVSNLTFVHGEQILAFDIGPGNALLDDWIRSHGAGDCDIDGCISAEGHVDQARLSAALVHPYFKLEAPKSLDRNAFSRAFVDGLNVADGAATLAAFTVSTIAAAVDLLPAEPHLWIVCGGGRRNPTLMAGLQASLGGDVVASDDCGIDGDALEAQAMAFLGARLLAGLPTSYPETTGAREPVIGGRVYRPRA